MANNPKKMEMGCSSSSCCILQTHEDVVTEIALHLPVHYLLRCRAVCKLWREVIDSPSFQKLHIRRSNKEEEEDDDETVYLHSFNLTYDGKVSLGKLVGYGNVKSLTLDLGFNRNWRSSNPVKGLIYCHDRICRPIAICNPFLGQIKILPSSPILASPDPSCDLRVREVGIGCDGEFYKVVELVYCVTHGCYHAHLYSKRTDSWRDLDDQPFQVVEPIDLSCSDGHFAHWDTYLHGILTFDMKNEVFRTIKVPNIGSICHLIQRFRIVAKDGYSFILFVSYVGCNRLVRVYESSICEEEGISKLSWNHVVNLETPLPLPSPTTPLPLWRRDCVMLRFADADKEVFFYDCGERRFLGCFGLPFISDLFYYKGTFISP